MILRATHIAVIFFIFELTSSNSCDGRRRRGSAGVAFLLVWGKERSANAAQASNRHMNAILG